ncbi:VOC family protein [Jatrophihabitans cynanchi]|uniref:VOC family protein n=1 Tax=Jatrophihabitans cynanchi TaxID=2944128 RepID=A0ABY7K0J9_9ACTN|nr:VOC family protein [Jatrophihabitans sp. SB3-54]WAX58374.1 VOC family protein [Jatrophihabitans sp. SB3-54]
MAKLRHIAIATRTPAEDAKFYEDTFGWQRLAGPADHPLGRFVVVTDGTVNIAFVDFSSDQIGKGPAYTGLHHIGVLVSDGEQAADDIQSHGGRRLDFEGGDDGGFEVKFVGPSGLVFDIAEHPWLGTSL